MSPIRHTSLFKLASMGMIKWNLLILVIILVDTAVNYKLIFSQEYVGCIFSELRKLHHYLWVAVIFSSFPWSITSSHLSQDWLKICFLEYFEENTYIDQKLYISLRINSMEKLQRKYSWKIQFSPWFLHSHADWFTQSLAVFLHSLAHPEVLVGFSPTKLRSIKVEFWL